MGGQSYPEVGARVVVATGLGLMATESLLKKATCDLDSPAACELKAKYRRRKTPSAHADFVGLRQACPQLQRPATRKVAAGSRTLNPLDAVGPGSVLPASPRRLRGC